MAKTVVEVEKNSNENSASLLRRFSRKVHEANIIRKAKNSRYNNRKPSSLKIKEDALRRIRKRKRIERLKKLGKIR